MNLTELSIRNPAGVVVGVLLACFLGIYAFVKLPVQLFPDVEEPAITITTQWRAAAPSEVEAQIVEPEEQALRGMPGLKELNAWANAGNAWLTLRFAPGTDMQATLIEVISRMNQLPPMPRDAQAPVISLGEDGGDSPNQTLSYFFVQRLPGTQGAIEDYRERVEKVLRPRIESVPGVSSVRFATGGPEELQIVFDPNRAAELGVQIPRIAALAGNADDVSGGFVDIGRRQYTVRFAGRYTPEQLSQLVLEWREGRPVRLGDVATVEVKRRDRTDLAEQNGNPAIGIRIMKENGANVLETLDAVKVQIEQLRTGPLAQMGLTIAQSFDPSVFINEAIDLVTGNLLSGVVLAVLALWYFVRDKRATLLVGLSIPICLLVTLVALQLTGRTLNVISLAGLAFGVGQALDTAIVVLEAIAHKRSQGLSTREATLVASKQVWPALLASTITAVIVFLPLVFMRDSASQLFADLALTISIAVVASLLVAVTVLPVAAARWLKADGVQAVASEKWNKLAAAIVSWTDTRKRRIAIVFAFLLAPAVLTWALLPPMDYLPPVKRDAIDGYFQFPPGASIETIDREIIQVMTKRLEPYMKGEQEPKLKNYYFLLWPGGGTIGVRPLDPNRIDELGKLINEKITVGFPDTETYASQGNLFGGFGDGRNIDFQLQSSDFGALLSVARRAQELIKEKLPGADIQATQGFDLAEPELRLTPDDRRISEVGWSRGDLGTVVRSLGDGAWVGEYFDGERRLDMILRARDWSSPEELASVMVSTPSGAAVPLGELVGVESTVGPTGLRRVDGRRTVGLNVSPPKNLSLQQAIDILKTQVEPEVRKLMPADGSIRYAGNAGNLEAALKNMRENVTLAFLVLFLVMAALFRSAKDSLYVMLTIPLASFGGVLGLWMLRLFTFQTLDLLTMVGFVVLMGLVVNNAILLTDETRAGEREGLSRRDAIAAALRIRTRPIVSITLTTLLGMLPMVVVPGPGSALYRGLGAVICGGMALNAVFTLILLPALLRLTERDASLEASSETSVMSANTLARPIAVLLALSVLPFAQDARAADSPAAPVVVVPAKQQSFAASVTATGTVASRNDARLSADVNGTLDWIAEPGRAVKQGDVVARLNEERLKLVLRDNEAAVKRLEANLQLLAAQSDRLQSLAAQNVVSRNQLDEAVSRRAMAEQELEQSRVARDRALLDLRHATVRAPFAGFVAERLQQAGEYVVAGATLARLVDTSNVEVIARAPIANAGLIRIGQAVRVSDEGRSVDSRVHSIIPIGDERSRLLELRIALEGNAWPIGSAVRIQLASANAQRAVTVPRDAVIQRQGAAYVFRIGSKSTAERVPVRVGPGRESEVEIVGEVCAGDRIVIRGGERLQPGQAVTVQPTMT